MLERKEKEGSLTAAQTDLLLDLRGCARLRQPPQPPQQRPPPHQPPHQPQPQPQPQPRPQPQPWARTLPANVVHGMQIFVTLKGKVVTIDIDPSSSVRQLQEKIQDKEGVPVGYQRLMFCGKQLDASRGHLTLSDVNITKESVLHLKVLPQPHFAAPATPTQPSRTTAAQRHANDGQAARSALLAMGFPDAVVVVALAANGGDAQRAAAMLIDQNRHPDAPRPVVPGGTTATFESEPKLDGRQRWSQVGGCVGPGCDLRNSIMIGDGAYVEGFHGTSANAAAHIIASGFRPSRGGMLGPGIYWSDDVNKTRPYVRDNSGTVLKLKVRPGRTKTVDHAGHPSQTTWHAEGYDSAWVPANTPPAAGWVRSGLSENCTFDPARIEVVAVSRDYGQTFESIAHWRPERWWSERQQAKVRKRRAVLCLIAIAMLAFIFASGFARDPECEDRIAVAAITAAAFALVRLAVWLGAHARTDPKLNNHSIVRMFIRWLFVPTVVLGAAVFAFDFSPLTGFASDSDCTQMADGLGERAGHAASMAMYVTLVAEIAVACASVCCFGCVRLLFWVCTVFCKLVVAHLI
jgi:hypothetical protein